LQYSIGFATDKESGFFGFLDKFSMRLEHGTAEYFLCTAFKDLFETLNLSETELLLA